MSRRSSMQPSSQDNSFPNQSEIFGIQVRLRFVILPRVRVFAELAAHGANSSAICPPPVLTPTRVAQPSHSPRARHSDGPLECLSRSRQVPTLRDPKQWVANGFSHALEVDTSLVGLHGAARRFSEAGGDDAMVEWQNAAACSHCYLRPDGYGIYRRNGRRFGFFLEFDRGRMNRRDYFKKLSAYYNYAITRRFERDYYRHPTILIVTTSNAAEELITRGAGAAAVDVTFLLLITSRWRIDDLTNPHGLLGPIWREPDADFDDRRCWIRHGDTISDPSWQDQNTPINMIETYRGGIVTETLLTVKEAASRLALGRTTVYELIARHQLKSIKIGRARRVPESALEQWIAQQVHEQAEEAMPAIAQPRTWSRSR